MRHSDLFRDSTELDGHELLQRAHHHATHATYRAVGSLVQAVEHLGAVSCHFQPYVPVAREAAASFSLRHTNVNLFNIASHLHRTALEHDLHDTVLAELGAVSTAQDRLDEACYIVRQYTKRRGNAALFAASARLGCWSELGQIARTVTLEAATCIDLTVPALLARDTGCHVQLLRALSRIPISDALSAAVSVAAPARS